MTANKFTLLTRGLTVLTWVAGATVVGVAAHSDIYLRTDNLDWQSHGIWALKTFKYDSRSEHAIQRMKHREMLEKEYQAHLDEYDAKHPKTIA
jgi:hypothetical protein